jgi:hypothetical protein
VKTINTGCFIQVSDFQVFTKAVEKPPLPCGCGLIHIILFKSRKGSHHSMRLCFLCKYTDFQNNNQVFLIFSKQNPNLNISKEKVQERQTDNEKQVVSIV